MILEELGEFEDYQLVDSGDGYRLERFGDYLLARPDPAVLWHKSLSETEWQKANALYIKREVKGVLARTAEKNSESIEEKGHWQNNSVPEQWLMHFGSGPIEISFYAKLTPFKHTGVFPEQAANWNFIKDRLKSGASGVKVLNLFGYTGIASVLCAKLGAEVTHVDASKPSITWAKENMLASGLPDDAIRWILEDVLKFVKREVRRGSKYDAIIMDPPAFGRGAKGEVWKFNEQLPQLLAEVAKLIDTENFKFLIVNAYAVSVSSLLLKNLLEDFARDAQIKTAHVDYGELVLKEKSGRLLSTGIFGRLF